MALLEITAGCSAIAAIASATAAWMSRAVAKEAKEQSAEFQRLAAVRELQTKVHMLQAGSRRVLVLCVDIDNISNSIAAMMGAMGGSAHEQEKASLEGHRKEVAERLRDADAVVANLPELSKGKYPDIVDVLARIDASLYAIQLSAGDREKALFEMIRVGQTEAHRDRSPAKIASS